MARQNSSLEEANISNLLRQSFCLLQLAYLLTAQWHLSKAYLLNQDNIFNNDLRDFYSVDKPIELLASLTATVRIVESTPAYRVSRHYVKGR
nr:hypothetical protein [Psychrobacter urativorans]